MGNFVLYRNGKRTDITGSIEKISQYVDATQLALKHRWQRIYKHESVVSNEIPIKIGSAYDNEEYMANVYAHRKVHKKEKKRANYEDRQFYVVYDMNDNVIVAGTAEECAERLSIGLASFYCKASNQNSDKYNARHPSTAPRKYYVYTLKDKEE